MATIQRQDTFSNSPLLRKTPWPGIAAISGMVICLSASAVVIGVSHDDLVSSWGIQPAVLLAIFSASSNIVFNTALATGIAVRFWLCASRGAKLSQLHYIWDHGRVLGIGSALRAGPPARTVAVFALLANVMQFVGAPLLQRSSTQVLQYHQSTESLSINIAREIPSGWFGAKDARGRLTNFDRAYPIIQQWWHNTSVSTSHQPGYTCPGGTCTGYVPGAGFTYNCWITSSPLQLATNKTDNSTVFLVRLQVAQNQTSPYLRLSSWYTTDITPDCVGTLYKETCDITTATVSYPITIQNNTVHLRREDMNLTTSETGRGPGPRVISPYPSPGDILTLNPNITAPTSSGIGPLTALQSFATNRITDNATKTYLENANPPYSYYAGPFLLADIFHVTSPIDESKTDPLSRCRLDFRSPTEYVLATLYDFTFRSAIILGNSTSSTQTFETQRTVPMLVFRTDGRYLAAGLVVMVCGLVFVVMLMWGWWQLERPVTLSPLETASAMGAPIFQEAERGATINEILAKVWNIEFRLGGGGGGSPRVETGVVEVGKG
ncbi:hypothetical protein B0T16DRAFT_461894 [Cercophora newfieldiana]|uniref:Uncharacterized protein n=1 Tax=Cercophora newfieldiana TaxID=92897 RepID=A0AA40CKK0_9PEZI|nr:hypothetical protein B0T16DRAFT_461894 [Cercophora newfieldiana]